MPHIDVEELTEAQKLDRVRWWLDNANVEHSDWSEYPEGYGDAQCEVLYLIGLTKELPEKSGYLERDPYADLRPPEPPPPVVCTGPVFDRRLTELSTQLIRDQTTFSDLLMRKPEDP